MKKSYLISALTLLFSLANATAAIPMRNQAVSEIAQYVFPENRAPSVGVTFTPDGSGYVSCSEDGKRLIILNVADGRERETILDLNNTRETTLPDFDGFTLSPDASKILLWRMPESIYRNSFDAEYYVYEVRTRLLKPLSQEFARQRDPIFSPDSRMVAFIAEGNIYCAKLDYGTEVAVTTGGNLDGTIHGATDWTYEEEFGITSAMAWAPDNLNLCYLSFDQSQIPYYNLPIYRGTCDARDELTLYPGMLTYRYPVAGQTNSCVTLSSYDIETRKTKQIALPGDPEYIPRIAYSPSPEKLMVATLNRDQNHFEIFSVNPKSTVAKSVYSQTSNAWIQPLAYENLWFGENEFAVATDQSGYTRFARFNYSGTPLGEISIDGADLTDFYGIDATGNIYWQAAAPTPMDRSLYCKDRRGNVKIIGAESGSTSAVFAPDMKSMMITYSNTTTPPTYTLCRADGSKIRTLWDNHAYSARALPLKATHEFFSFTSGGNTFNGYIVKPANFNPSGNYPVVMTQYSGPGSQSVLNRWTLDWEDYFAAKGFVVVCVDGRGTGGRGTEFRTGVYRRLGELETEDQIAAARYVASQPWADASKIGICGWSYGGYETLMAASADDAPFAAAVAIAPVSDWRFYDTVYTERYMLTPQQNENGYNTASALLRATNLQCPLLIMYGTLDDNVHPANSLEYISRLQASGIFADMFVFPNMNHSIYGCNARAVVYGRMFQYFSDHLR